MKNVLIALAAVILFTSTLHAQTGWTYHAGPISPMTDARVDHLTVRSTEPLHGMDGRPVLDDGKQIFAVLTVECSAGGPHTVWFSSSAHLDADVTGATSIIARFGYDPPTSLFTVPLYRDGVSFILPSQNDATAIKLAHYDRLRLQIQVHNQPDQFVEFAVGGLATLAESRGCPLPQS